MKTTLKEEKELRNIKSNIDLEELATKGSLIPGLYVAEDRPRANDVIFCETISGGKGFINDMPKELTLTRLVDNSAENYINDKTELDKYEAVYKQVIGDTYTQTPDFLGDTEEERYERQLELKKQGIELQEIITNGDIVDLKQINTKTPEGKLLMAALAFITTSNRTNKTPYEVIEELNIIKSDMYNKK